MTTAYPDITGDAEVVIRDIHAIVKEAVVRAAVKEVVVRQQPQEDMLLPFSPQLKGLVSTMMTSCLLLREFHVVANFLTTR